MPNYWIIGVIQNRSAVVSAFGIRKLAGIDEDRKGGKEGFDTQSSDLIERAIFFGALDRQR